MAEGNGRKHTNIVARFRLFRTDRTQLRKDALHLRAKEFESYILSHVGNVVPLQLRVNYALSVKISRPISMRRISEVPAPIS